MDAKRRPGISKLRYLDADDASAYRALRLMMLEESPTAFSADYHDALNLNAEHFIERARYEPDNFIVGAFDATHLIGSASGFREKATKRAHIATVWGMYVHPDHRGKGLGRELLTQVIDGLRELDGLERVLIGVTAGNEAAHGLYVSFGFKPYGVEPAATKVDGIDYDEVLMQLDLSERE